MKTLKYGYVSRGNLQAVGLFTPAELKEIRVIESKSTEEQEFVDQKDNDRHKELFYTGINRFDLIRHTIWTHYRIR